MAITDRFITAQAQNFNVHVDFPLFQRLALPIQVGKTKIPGIKIHNTRIIRLMEVLLHYASEANGWTSAQIHSKIRKTFNLSEGYTITQLRYDLRKMKAHGLLERHDRRYSYRLTEKGRKVALMFVLFHKNLCGPIANSLFHHRPEPSLRPDSKLETAYHKADDALQRVINILEAA
jgi:DNA-binding PadR family transcriptional regulator